jgi:putative phosphoesterase
MRIGIISDTHDQVARTSKAVSLLIAEAAEVLIHCGDLTGPSIVHECGGLPSYYVFGNNDFNKRGLREAMVAVGGVCLGDGGLVELAGKRIAVTHGDEIGEVRRLMAESPDYLLYGHSHLAADRREGSTRCINPGALHRAASWTVGILDLATGAMSFLSVL